MSMKIRRYSELIRIPTFEGRFNYLKLNGKVGEETFGWDRYLNQYFYQHRAEWQRARNKVIVRDQGCDLGVLDREIGGPIAVHHMNPIALDDILNESPFLLNPEYLISTDPNTTHKAIHFGSIDMLFTEITERRPNDTCPWR